MLFRSPQPVRHPDARRLAQSGAGEDDRRIARKRVDPARKLVGGDPHSALEVIRGVVVATDVEQRGTAGQEQLRLVDVEPNGQPPKKRVRRHHAT